MTDELDSKQDSGGRSKFLELARQAMESDAREVIIKYESRRGAERAAQRIRGGIEGWPLGVWTVVGRRQLSGQGSTLLIRFCREAGLVVFDPVPSKGRPQLPVQLLKRVRPEHRTPERGFQRP